MRIPTILVLLSTTVLPLVDADTPEVEIQGVCLLEPDGGSYFPGYANIAATEFGSGGRQGIRQWIPEDASQPTKAYGRWQFTGSCSILEEIHRFIACVLEARTDETCDTPLDPNIAFTVA